MPALFISFLLCNNLIHKVWVDLINERQHKTQGFLGKISASHGINHGRGQWVLPKSYNYLNPTKLLNLCCCCSVYPFGFWIYCGSITRQQFFLSFTLYRKDFVDCFVDILCTLGRLCRGVSRTLLESTIVLLANS